MGKLCECGLFLKKITLAGCLPSPPRPWWPSRPPSASGPHPGPPCRPPENKYTTLVLAKKFSTIFRNNFQILKRVKCRFFKSHICGKAVALHLPSLKTSTSSFLETGLHHDGCGANSDQGGGGRGRLSPYLIPCLAG